MKKIALALMLVLSTCSAEPAFANDSHKVLSPIRWYAMYVWRTGKGMQFLDPRSVEHSRQPQYFDSRDDCLNAGDFMIERMNKKNAGFGRPTAELYCIAARNKLQLRQHIRMLDLNFGGQPV